jgi:hypothetical protein
MYLSLEDFTSLAAEGFYQESALARRILGLLRHEEAAAAKQSVYYCPESKVPSCVLPKT